MTTNRIILAAAVLGVLGAARTVHAQACCTELDAYANEVGSQACTDGQNNWTCPVVRAHYPAQRFCDDQGIGPMTCHGRRAKVMIQAFSVRCGTFQNRCPDGLPAVFRVPADNDLCSGRCLGRSGTSSDCEQSKRDRLKEQTDELERLFQDATTQPEK